MRKYAVFAYDSTNNVLFFRFVTDKNKARQEIMSSAFYPDVSYVKYNNVKYPLTEVYKWGQK